MGNGITHCLQIADVVAPPPLVETVNLCDRCAAAMADAGALTLDRLKLRGARILVDKVAPVTADVQHVSEHIVAPIASERTRQLYGVEARVLAIGPDIDTADIAPGDRVIIDEFAGRPIWWGDCALPYWIVGEGEVMVVLCEDVK